MQVSKKVKKEVAKTSNGQDIVCCMDCLHSRLFRYGCNPILAECLQNPQPGNERFPYQREVARALRTCKPYEHTDKVKDVEIRSVA